MKTILHIILTSLLLSGIGFSATRSDIIAIEAAEKIRFLSQKIAKNYFFLYNRPKNTGIKKEIADMVDEIGINFSTIASSTKDEDTKYLLDFLEYNKDSIVKLLSQRVTRDNSLLMLDYSEVLLEGANSIAQARKYEFNKEETMLMNMKKYEFLIERLGKFYMVSGLGTLSDDNKIKFAESQKALEVGIETIKAYQYPKKFEKTKKELIVFWDSIKYFLTRSQDMFVPNIVNTTAIQIEHLLAQFAVYHSKNQ